MSFAASLFGVSFGPSGSMGSSGFWVTQSAPLATFAGVQVDERIALQVTAVYRAVALISEAVAMLPIDVLQKTEGRREEQSDHPVAQLLRNPNPLMNTVDLRSTLQAHALQYGNAYMDVSRTEGGRPIELWPLLPDRTRAVGVDGAEGRSIVYRTLIDGTVFEIAPADIAHIHGLAFDGLRGYSPLHLAKQAIGLALGLEEYGAKFFGNDAKSGGFLEHPGKLNDEAQKNLRDSMAQQGGIDNAHRIKILEEGMKFNATTIAPEDAQFLMTRTFQVEEIARLYGVPLHMLQSHSKTTSWGSGIAQMSLGFLIYTLEPWLVRWEQELGRKLFTEAEVADGYYLKHNVNALLRADAVSRARFYTAALNRATGWLARDEVRALEDMNPDGVENETATASEMAPFGDAPQERDPDEQPESDRDE